MTDMDAKAATALRRPFPPESIGQLPKGGQMLDYAGHAAVTDRLLSVDPYWTWEPFAVTPQGLPAPDPDGNFWIRLTVCGVTRIGVGDGKNAKERIGDAIRNAAMRFGVALDLWAKENLVEFAQHAATAARNDSGTRPPVEGAAGESGHSPAKAPARSRKPVQEAIAKAQSNAVETGELMTANTRGRLFALFGEHGITDRAEQIRGITHIIGREISSRSEITDSEAQVVIGVLASRPRPGEPQ